MDLYLLNTIVNIIWYIFTSIFLLYRFTTFFSYLLNITRFCGTLWHGMTYITGFCIRDSNDYVPIANAPQKTYFQRTKDYVSTWFKPKQNVHTSPIPLYQTQTSTLFTPTSHLLHEESLLFDKHMQDLSNESDEDRGYFSSDERGPRMSQSLHMLDTSKNQETRISVNPYI